MILMNQKELPLVGRPLVTEFALDKEFTINVLGDSDSELFAALGASVSRDPASLKERTESLTERVKERIMGRYFRDYGHNSVGEMGQIFLSIEGISMPAAWKTISFRRFAGQEASTRYIDFSDQEYVLPPSMRKHACFTHAVDSLFSTYRRVLDLCMEHFTEKSGGGLSEAEARPKAFDIAGGFLPGAAKTSVVIASDIRNLIEQGQALRSYQEDQELHEVGDTLLRTIDALCPNSVPESAFDDEQQGKWGSGSALLNRKLVHAEDFCVADVECFKMQKFSLSDLGRALKQMHRLSEEFDHFGVIQARAPISFRSLRDVYRHRMFGKMARIVRPVTLAPWHCVSKENQCFEAVGAFKSDSARDLFLQEVEEVNKLMRGVEAEVRKQGLSEFSLLYALPMGVRMHVELTGGISQWLYFLKLRSGKKVHPEVRTVVHCIAEEIALAFRIPFEYLVETAVATDYRRRSRDA